MFEMPWHKNVKYYDYYDQMKIVEMSLDKIVKMKKFIPVGLSN